MGKRGRPAKTGERYPCGKLRPTGEPVSGAMWHRIRDHAARVARDERLASELGRLSFHKEITDAQAAAGFRVGLIYGMFERHYAAPPRKTRSPSYQIGLAGDAGLAEELMEREAFADQVRRRRASLEAFLALQDEFASWEFSRNAASVRPDIEHHGATRRTPRLLIEAVCVDDCTVAYHELPVLRWALDRLVAFFGSAKKRARERGRIITHAVTGGPQLRTGAQIRRSAQEKFVRALRPDLDDDAVRRACDILSAMLDREFFDARKQRDVRVLHDDSA